MLLFQLLCFTTQNCTGNRYIHQFLQEFAMLQLQELIQPILCEFCATLAVKISLKHCNMHDKWFR